MNPIMTNIRSGFTVKESRELVRSQFGLSDTVFLRDKDIDNWLTEFQNRLARDEEWYITFPSNLYVSDDPAASIPPNPVSEDDFYYWPPRFDTAAVFYACGRAALKDYPRSGEKYSVFKEEYDQEYEKAKATLHKVEKEQQKEHEESK